MSICSDSKTYAIIVKIFLIFIDFVKMFIMDSVIMFVLFTIIA